MNREETRGSLDFIFVTDQRKPRVSYGNLRSGHSRKTFLTDFLTPHRCLEIKLLSSRDEAS